VSQRLSSKPQLMARAQRALPAGTDLNAATAGFKNFGQFVAAVNVSTNLGVSFVELRAAMTGTTLTGDSTGQTPVSLGRAIQRLRPGVDAATETQRAERQATVDIEGTR
jgi:hypothetical protein